MSDVRVAFRKWGGRPHWEFDATVVGEDEHGVWVGAPIGTPVHRPGAAYEAPADFVSVIPPDHAFVATFYAEHPRPAGSPPIELYVDITTVPTWGNGDHARLVTMVDLDLDVVRGRSGRVWVDDEDEFADHRVRFGYPDDVVRLAATSCETVLAEVVAGRGVFAPELGRLWLSRLPSCSPASWSPARVPARPGEARTAGARADGPPAAAAARRTPRG